MMKKSSLFCLLAAAMLFTSCIREEAANVECDITGVDPSWIESMPAGFFLGEPNIQKNSVTFLVNESSDVTALAPRFTVSDGATSPRAMVPSPPRLLYRRSASRRIHSASSLSRFLGIKNLQHIFPVLRAPGTGAPLSFLFPLCPVPYRVPIPASSNFSRMVGLSRVSFLMERSWALSFASLYWFSDLVR